MSTIERFGRTRVYRLPDLAAYEAGHDALETGELVAFPTDTVYGLACDLWQEKAVARLYEAKERPARLPIPVLVSAEEHVDQVAQNVSPAVYALIKRFWPGGLTIVLERREKVPARLVSGGPTIAVRMPDHPVAQQMIERVGGALAVTSANRSGQPAATDVAGVIDQLADRIAIVLDGGGCPGGVPSTVVDMASTPPRILRVGAIGPSALRVVLPDLAAGTE